VEAAGQDHQRRDGHDQEGQANDTHRYVVVFLFISAVLRIRAIFMLLRLPGMWPLHYYEVCQNLYLQ
jgi:hypothetical protein